MLTFPESICKFTHMYTTHTEKGCWVSGDDRNTPRPTLRGLHPPPAKNRSVTTKKLDDV